MVFYINLSILFIKNFLTYLLLVDNVYNQNFKFLIIIIIISICNYFIYKYHLDFTQIVDKPMDTIGKQLTNICIIMLFIIFFIGGVFFIRFSNINRSINLPQIYERIFEFYLRTDVLNLVMIIILLISLIILYIQMFQLLVRVFKYNVIKRHIWFYKYTGYGKKFSVVQRYCRLHQFDKQFKYKLIDKYFWFIYYTNGYAFMCINLKRVTIQTLEIKVCIWLCNENRFYYNKIQPYFKGFHQDMLKITPFIIFKGHYILLILTILYDLFFNKGILEHMFILLPFVFIYEMYYKMSKFIYYIQWDYDELLYKVIYQKKGTFFYTNYEFNIDGNNYTMGDLHYARDYYLRRGLHSYVLDREGREQEGDIDDIINTFNEKLVDNPAWEEQIKDIKLKFLRFD
jgi:hypothetical protein